MTAAEDPGKADGPPPLQDRPFNPYRIPISDASRAVVAEAVGMLQKYERIFGKRQRTRRPADQAAFEATVSAVLCDVMHHQLSQQPGGIFITRSNRILGRRSRYRPAAYGKTLPAILDMMAAPEMAFVTAEIGHQGHFSGPQRTTLRPGKRTLWRIQEHGIELDDLGVSDSQEAIILRREKNGFWDAGDNVEYEDTPTTRLYRRQMIEINGWLDQAEIDFDEFLSRASGRVVDARDRRLRRIFTQGRFDRGGRLFGGFWQALGKQQRREGILIGGEAVVELDFGQMNPRIIYGLCGAQPDCKDIYEIPGFEHHRAGIKKVMNAMMFTTKPPTRMPKGVRKTFAEHHRIEEVLKAIEAAHPAITAAFYTGIGHAAQFVESQIMVDALLSLKRDGVVALPLHDALLVPGSGADHAREVMLSTFERHTGIEGVVVAR